MAQASSPTLSSSPSPPFLSLRSRPAARPLAYVGTVAVLHAAWVGCIVALGHAGNTKAPSKGSLGGVDTFVVACALALSAALPIAFGAAISACGASFGGAGLGVAGEAAGARRTALAAHCTLLVALAGAALAGCGAVGGLMVQPQLALNSNQAPVDGLWQFLGAIFGLVEFFCCLSALWALSATLLAAAFRRPRPASSGAICTINSVFSLAHHRTSSVEPAPSAAASSSSPSASSLPAGASTGAAPAPLVVLKTGSGDASGRQWHAAFAPPLLLAPPSKHSTSLVGTASSALKSASGLVSLGNAGVLAALFICLVLPVLLSMILPPAWSNSSHTWYSTASPKAAGVAHTLGQYTMLSPKLTMAVPELVLRGSSIPTINIRLFGDVVVYFVSVGAVVLVGALAQVVPSLRRLLAKRVRIQPACLCVPGRLRALVPHEFALNTFGVASVGELLLLAAIAGLFCWWTWYWGVFYTRRVR